MRSYGCTCLPLRSRTTVLTRVCVYLQAQTQQNNTTDAQKKRKKKKKKKDFFFSKEILVSGVVECRSNVFFLLLRLKRFQGKYKERFDAHTCEGLSNGGLSFLHLYVALYVA